MRTGAENTKGNLPLTNRSGTEPSIRLIYWNCFGFKNIMDISEYVNEYDVLCLTETWLTSNKVSASWLLNYDFVFSYATKEKCKGRAKGGILVAYCKKHYKHKIIENNNEMLLLQIFAKNIKIIVAVLYLNPLMDIDVFLGKFKNILEEIIDRFPHIPILVGGGFNAQIGELDFDSNVIFNKNLLSIRKSLDKNVNSRGRKTIEVMNSNNFSILNGKFAGDSPGQYTYYGVFRSIECFIV